ncbi:MAG TPA: hypothetical protein VFJ15_00170 [Oleiagrimonas sp.]|nr:hypothetical protein [Oleiagrimonas sp.]
MHRSGTFLVAGVLALAVAGCSQPSAPTPAQKAAADKAKTQAALQKKLDLFHKLMAMHNPDLAIPIGEDIVKNFPDSKAAKKLSKTLPEMKAKAHAASEKRRLTGLWLYQVGPMAGGTQSTATIKPSKPKQTQVRLTLRRQTDWGVSTFLYDNAKGKNAGFVCHKLCDIVMHFDGKKHVYEGYLPKGGEPAMFIKDHDSFLKRLAKADKITMLVAVKGQGKQTFVFETGGFNPDKWQTLP